MSNIVLYAWRNDDWGAWFYAGIGSKQRAYETDQRSKEFQRIFRNHRCSCHILQEFQEGESDKEITLTEKIVKEILKSFGEPISDGEPEFLRRERQREGIERATRNRLLKCRISFILTESGKCTAILKLPVFGMIGKYINRCGS